MKQVYSVICRIQLSTVITILLLLVLVYSQAQVCELIDNGDFESFTPCPSNLGEMYAATPWDKPGPNSGSSDYFNGCSSHPDVKVPGSHWGNRSAYSGDAYAGFAGYNSLPNYREYIHQKLLAPMVVGETYEVSFYWARSKKTKHAIDGVGALLTTTPIVAPNGSVLSGVPQIGLGSGVLLTDTAWTKLVQTISPTMAFEYITIGSFNNDQNIVANNVSNSAPFWGVYYFVDDVSIKCITCAPDPGKDSTFAICSNAPVFDLFSALGGTPDTGGVWSPSLTSGTGVFDPQVDPPGTYTYSLGTGCDSATADITIDLVGGGAADFHFNDSAFCVSDLDPIPVITGIAGGTFKIDKGGAVDVFTGKVDLDQTGPGAYHVYYSVGGSCQVKDSFAILIEDTTHVSIDPAGPFCNGAGSQFLVASAGGGVWTGDGVLSSNSGEFDPTVAGVGHHQVVYQLPGPCLVSATITVVVEDLDVAAISYDHSSYCLFDPDPLPSFQGSGGGQFSMDGVGEIDEATGQVDIEGSGVGNFIVTYTSAGVCPVTVTTNVQIVDCPLPQALFSLSDSNICVDDCIVPIDLSSNSLVWNWTFSGASVGTSTDQNPTGVCFDQPGTYSIVLTVSNEHGTDSYTLNVHVWSPTVDAGRDETVEQGSSVELQATGGPGDYSWSPSVHLSCAECQITTAIPDVSMIYTLTLVDEYGCEATDDVMVNVVKKDAKVFVPNAFSPDANELNELFFPVGEDLSVAGYVFHVFNRWGELVFITDRPTQGWDGRFNGQFVQQGVYVWKLEFTGASGRMESRMGKVTLLR